MKGRGERKDAEWIIANEVVIVCTKNSSPKPRTLLMKRTGHFLECERGVNCTP